MWRWGGAASRPAASHRGSPTRSYDGINTTRRGFDIREGETPALVGESGCGKTTTVTQILRMVTPQTGTVTVHGRSTTEMSRPERFAIRRDMQVVFQDPYASLDPRLPVGDILDEPLSTHGVAAAERRERIRDLTTLVGLSPGACGPVPA